MISHPEESVPTLRPLTQGDADALYRLWSYEQRSVFPSMAPHTNYEWTMEFVRRSVSLCDGKKLSVWLIELDHKLAGYIQIFGGQNCRMEYYLTGMDRDRAAAQCVAEWAVRYLYHVHGLRCTEARPADAPWRLPE